MHATHARDFVCPNHRVQLRMVDPVFEGESVQSGFLACSYGCSYPIQEGLPNFIDPATLTETERKSQSNYDRAAFQVFENYNNWQFEATYEDEDSIRESMIDMLDLAPGMRVLEVGCGTGRDSYRLARRLGGHGVFHMHDLSPVMIKECIRRVTSHQREMGFGCALEYGISRAASLPFPDGYFDAVYHFGGFNFFGDLKHAAAELARVAKQGARVVIGDEAVAPWLKGSEFDAIVTTNNPLFKAETPIDALPVSARDVTVRWIIGNCFYVMSFRKGDGPPPLNMDLPHKGWRGGTMRSRYFGTLEGVRPETKELARSAAKKLDISLHEWLDRVVGNEADRVLTDGQTDETTESEGLALSRGS